MRLEEQNGKHLEDTEYGIVIYEKPEERCFRGIGTGISDPRLLSKDAVCCATPAVNQISSQLASIGRRMISVPQSTHAAIDLRKRTSGPGEIIHWALLWIRVSSKETKAPHIKSKITEAHVIIRSPATTAHRTTSVHAATDGTPAAVDCVFDVSFP
jgi:hypothetical protein